MATILLLGTCDSKLPELLYTKHQIHHQNPTNTVLLLDLGHAQTTHPEINITLSDILKDTTENVDVSSLPRAEYIQRLLTHATTTVSNLHHQGKFSAIIGIGGSCGTSLATGIMQKALPVGFPKLMVSTMASGDVKPYVEETDITMMYSVVDIAGRNRILEGILQNAAAAVSGMANSYFTRTTSADEKGQGGGEKKRIGITMFGVTTPCVDRVRQYLETHSQNNYEVYIFHATGAGGKAMERLIRETHLDAIIDLTTSEIADELVGGILTAGPERLSAAAARGIPQVVSLGACDMVNFGLRETVPPRFGEEQERRWYEHNPTVTLMRTTSEECRGIARFVARKLRGCARPERVRVVLPTGGVSMLGVPGQAFHDPEADAALFDTLEQELGGTSIHVQREPRQINDPDFAVALTESLLELMALP